jgi:hypothetical protein
VLENGHNKNAKTTKSILLAVKKFGLHKICPRFPSVSWTPGLLSFAVGEHFCF